MFLCCYRRRMWWWSKDFFFFSSSSSRGDLLCCCKSPLLYRRRHRLHRIRPTSSPTSMRAVMTLGRRRAIQWAPSSSPLAQYTRVDRTKVIIAIAAVIPEVHEGLSFVHPCLCPPPQPQPTTNKAAQLMPYTPLAKLYRAEVLNLFGP